MESTFEMAYHTYGSWTSEQCSRMLTALKERLAEEQDDALESAGLFDDDPLFQPVAQNQLRRELLCAQEAYRKGDYVDALSFCDEMERRKS